MRILLTEATTVICAPISQAEYLCEGKLFQGQFVPRNDRAVVHVLSSAVQYADAGCISESCRQPCTASKPNRV